MQTHSRALTIFFIFTLFCLFSAPVLAEPPCLSSNQTAPSCLNLGVNANAAPPCLRGSAGVGNNVQVAHGRFLAESVLAAYASQADVRLESVLQSLKTLAITQEVRSGNWDSMEQLISEFQQQNPYLLVFYINPDGSYYTPAMGLTGKNLSDRDYFPGLMQGNDVVGNIVVGKTSGKKSFIVGTPVTKDGVVTGAMGAAVYADSLATAIENGMPVPKSMVIVATDQNNTLALCSGLNQAGNPPCQKTGALPCVNTGNQDLDLSVTSSLTGWKFSIVPPNCVR